MVFSSIILTIHAYWSIIPFMLHRFVKRGHRTVRIDTDQRWVFARSLQILDLKNDRVLVIPESDWPKYEGSADIIQPILQKKLVETPVIRELDLGFKSN